MNNGQIIVVLTYTDETIKSEGHGYVDDLAKRVIDTVNNQDEAIKKHYEEEKFGNSVEKLVRSCLYAPKYTITLLCD